MEGMIIEVRNEEAALGDFKRRTTKDAMGLKCGGLLEMAEKLTVSILLASESLQFREKRTRGIRISQMDLIKSLLFLLLSQIVAEIGKLMVEEIPLDITEPGMPRRQYDGKRHSSSLSASTRKLLIFLNFLSDFSALSSFKYRLLFFQVSPRLNSYFQKRLDALQMSDLLPLPQVELDNPSEDINETKPH